jgi:hypothetical protein
MNQAQTPSEKLAQLRDRLKAAGWTADVVIPPAEVRAEVVRDFALDV